MSEPVNKSGQTFAEFMKSFPQEEIDRVNAMQRKEAADQHAAFQEAFKVGRCIFCGEALTSFDRAKPCRHWLLKPEGVRKEHIQEICRLFSWGILENYLRWVANEEKFAQNINDLSDEGTGTLLELTIKYKTLEWSFSCSENDLKGHEGGGEHSKKPHFHFQMYVDGKPLVRYNDYHLPISEADARFLEFMRANPGKVKRRIFGGTGMDEVFDTSSLDDIVRAGRSAKDEDDAATAPFKLDSFVVAEPGTSISGEDIARLAEEAEAEGVTLSSKLSQLKNVRVQTIISPGPGVVHQATRSGRKRRGGRKLRAEDRAWRERQKRQS